MLQVMKDIQKLANTNFYSYTQLFSKKSVQLKIQKTKTAKRTAILALTSKRQITATPTSCNMSNISNFSVQIVTMTLRL